MLGGEAFVDVSEDVATAHCEAEQAAVQAELDALERKGGELRVGSFEQPRPVRVRRSFESSQFAAVTPRWSGEGHPESAPVRVMPEWVGMATAVGLAALTVGTVVALVIIWDTRPRSNPNQDTAPTASPVGSMGVPLISW